MRQYESIAICAKRIAHAAKMGGYQFETNIDPDSLHLQQPLSELEATETAARIILQGHKPPKICESKMGGWIIKH